MTSHRLYKLERHTKHDLSMLCMCVQYHYFYCQGYYFSQSLKLFYYNSTPVERLPRICKVVVKQGSYPKEYFIRLDSGHSNGWPFMKNFTEVHVDEFLEKWEI